MQRIIAACLIVFSSVSYAVDRSTIEFYFHDTDLRIVDDARGSSILLPSDRFFLVPGDPTLNINEYPALDDVLYVIKKCPGVDLSITAHTDNVPPQDYQYEMSYLYAKQVADYLAAGGVDPERIVQVSGEGDQWPVASNETAKGRAMNRRVEITFLSKPSRLEHRHPVPPGVQIPGGLPVDRGEREFYKGK